MTTGVRWRPSWMLLGVGALLLALAGAASVYAASSSPARARAGVTGGRALVSALTSQLGISAQQLRSDLADGQTLSQIANANGSTANQLEQTLLGVVQSRLAKALGAGKITSAQEQGLLTRAGTAVDKLVNATHPAARLERLGVRLRVTRFVARYIGITPQQLRAQIAGGSTLSEILSTRGKSASDLEQTLLAAAKTRLVAAVGAGRLGSDRAQALLTRLQQRLDQLLGQSSSSTTSG